VFHHPVKYNTDKSCRGRMVQNPRVLISVRCRTLKWQIILELRKRPPIIYMSGYTLGFAYLGSFAEAYRSMYRGYWIISGIDTRSSSITDIIRISNNAHQSKVFLVSRSFYTFNLMTCFSTWSAKKKRRRMCLDRSKVRRFRLTNPEVLSRGFLTVVLRDCHRSRTETKKC
jgi:hypothetical protein